MAYFYVVAKTKDDYDLIKIDDGNSLEDIDLYTTKFKTSDNFIKHLNNNGLNLSDDVDLFIVTKEKSRRDGDRLVYRELMYDNKELEDLAKDSKENRCNNLRLFGKFLNISVRSDKLRTILSNNLFVCYGSFKKMMNKSLGRGSLTLDKNEIWLKNSYLVGRDVLYALDLYEKEKNNLDNNGIKKLVDEKEKLTEDRNQLEKPLMMKIKDGFDQMMLIGEPNNSIHLSYINVSKIAEDANKVVTKESKTGQIKGTDIDKLNVPYDVVVDEVPENSIPIIGNFLISPSKMPLGSIKINKDKKTNSYELNFNKLEEKFGVTYTDEDKKFLNSLLGSELKKNLFYAQMYSDDFHKFSTESQIEASHYQQQVFKTLDKYEKKQPNMYKKAYNFYLIHSKMVNKKRGGYGSK